MSTKYAENVVNRFNSIGKNTEYIGFISNEKVKEIMSHASIVVVPSLWNEPFGLVAAEAMSRGAAVISSNLGGLKEVVGHSGVVIDNIDDDNLKNEVVKLIQNKPLLKKIQKQGFKNFNFKSEDISKKLDKFREDIFYLL